MPAEAGRSIRVIGAQAGSLMFVLWGKLDWSCPVVITRRGKPIAELVPRRSVRDLLPQLAVLRASLPEQT